MFIELKNSNIALRNAYDDNLLNNRKDIPLLFHYNAIFVISSRHTEEQCIRNWKMPARYYTKEINGVSFIILNGNDKGASTHKGGYPAYINNE